MSVGEAIVKLQRSLGSSPPLRDCFLSREEAKIPEVAQAEANAGISGRVLWFFGNRLLKEFDGTDPSRPGRFIEVVAPLQIQLVGFGVVGVALQHRLFFFTEQLHLERADQSEG